MSVHPAACADILCLFKVHFAPRLPCQNQHQVIVEPNSQTSPTPRNERSLDHEGHLLLRAHRRRRSTRAVLRRGSARGAADRRRVEADQGRERPPHPGARRLGGVGARQAGQRRGALRQGGERRGAGRVRDELQAGHRGDGRRREERDVRGGGVRAGGDQDAAAADVRAGELRSQGTSCVWGWFLVYMGRVILIKSGAIIRAV